MFSYRITKYNPEYRNEEGLYLKDDWTAYSDIGKRYDNEKIIKGMHRAIAAYAHAGNNVIVDYITYDPTWITDLQFSLRGINTIYVGVTASLATIQQREKTRGTSPEGHGRSLYESVHTGWKYDFLLDTDAITPDQAADRITQYLEQQTR